MKEQLCRYLAFGNMCCYLAETGITKIPSKADLAGPEYNLDLYTCVASEELNPEPKWIDNYAETIEAQQECDKYEPHGVTLRDSYPFNFPV